MRNLGVRQIYQRKEQKHTLDVDIFTKANNKQTP